MSMKKTDMTKKLASTLDSKRKTSAIPDRFGKQSNKVAPTTETMADAKAQRPKLVAVTCRLPSDLAVQLREMALSHEDGIHGLMTDAARLLLDKAPAKKSTKA